MFKRISRMKCVFIEMSVLASLIALPLDHALAALVDTQSTSEGLNSDATKGRLLSLLAREEVRIALLRHGISPSEVEARIHALTDSEAHQIEMSLGELHAGGGYIGAMLPAWVGILAGVAVGLIVTLLIVAGVWAGIKLEENRNATAANTPPIPSRPPKGVMQPDMVEPWTAKWKVTQGQLAGMWVFKQTGDRVISTGESDYVVDARVSGFTIRGTWSEKVGKAKGDFKATIAEDALSFNADAQYWPRVYFTANRVE